MQVLVISNFCFKSDYSRPYLAYKYFKRNYDTKIIYSNFHHQEKEFKEYNDLDMIPIDTWKYTKNISIKRIISHIKFSQDVLKELKKHNPQIVYVNVPPNILGVMISRYCRRKGIRVICDVVDLWPESFPINGVIGGIFNKTLGALWKSLRSHSLKSASLCIAESEYFVKKFLGNYNVKTIHLAKITDNNYIKNYNIDSEKVVIGYVGSISNIYDFDSLIEILKQIKKRKNVLLKIIGDGERRQWLLSELDSNSISYKYYGKIFNENEKAEILEDCLFGYNGYKNETEVALSYKSLDYLSYAIPLINSTKGDTKYIVEKYRVGINFDSNNIKELVDKILMLKDEEIIEMRHNSLNVFNELFSWNSYIVSMDKALIELQKE